MIVETGLKIEALRVGLVGYGEVGGIFGAALRARGVEAVIGYDVKFADAAQSAAMRARAARDGVALRDSGEALAAEVDMIVSAVTASQAVAAAMTAARAIRPGTWFVDLNSASPGARARAAAAIDAAGGRYVEAAVMTSVPPYGIRVPMLLGGPHARACVQILSALGCDATPVAETLGTASAIKMCRSVMIKGMEALVIESFSAARAYGVEQRVLESLRETFPGIDWEQQASYFFQRVIQHGRRRAEEMREVAETVREAGLQPWMSSASAERQDAVASLTASGAFAGLDPKASAWRDNADRVLAARPDGVRHRG